MDTQWQRFLSTAVECSLSQLDHGSSVKLPVVNQGDSQQFFVLCAEN